MTHNPIDKEEVMGASDETQEILDLAAKILSSLNAKVVKKESVHVSATAVITYQELEALIQVIKDDRQATRKQTASEIFNLAHEYAQNDPDMRGAEQLRNYHYYNAIHKVGEFDGR